MDTITCLRCEEAVPEDDLTAHLEAHGVTAGDLESVVDFLRADAVQTVEAAAAAAKSAALALEGAVTRARGAGASWTDIGRAAGMSRQSARERWSR